MSWAQVVRLATNTRNLHQLTRHASPYTTDSVHYIQYRYSHWDEVQPFRSIPFERAGAIYFMQLFVVILNAALIKKRTFASVINTLLVRLMPPNQRA